MQNKSADTHTAVAQLSENELLLCCSRLPTCSPAAQVPASSAGLCPASLSSLLPQRHAPFVVVF